MAKLKDGRTREQVAESIARRYLLNCYSSISYLPIADMSPEEGVDYLLKLKQAGEIEIEVKTVGELLVCSIIPTDQN